MNIEKILNNNVAVTRTDSGEEIIVMGRRIAFKKKIGDSIDPSAIDKEFRMSTSGAKSKFEELVTDIPMEHIKLGERIISYAKSSLGKPLNEMIYISLIDHIHSSLVRLQDGITVKNALLWDIRRFYPDEFSIGKSALSMIEESCGAALPEDEAGFIALHIVNAEIDETGMQTMYDITKIMQEIVNIVRYTFNIEFNEDSVYYYRFITHLKFFAQRLLNGKTYADDSDDDLYSVVKRKYQNSHRCAEKINQFIVSKYSYTLSKEELLYLTIHIERLVYKSEENA